MISVQRPDQGAHDVQGRRSRAALLDEFGQTLGKDATLTFTVGDAHPTFFGPSGMVVARSGGEEADARLLHDELRAAQGPALPGRRRATTTRSASTCATSGTRTSRRRCRARRSSISSSKTTGGAERARRDRRSIWRRRSSKGGLGHAIAIVEPYPWTESYEPPRMISVGAVDEARRRRVRRRRQPDRVRDRARDRQAGGGRRARDPAVRHQGARPTTRASRRCRSASGGVKGAHYLIAQARRRRRVRRRRRRLLERVRQLGQADRGRRSLAWYVIDDRKMYKPGEEVSLKGWLRTIDYGKDGDVGGLGGAVTVGHATRSPTRSGNEIAQGLDAGQRGRRLRHQVHAAEDAEPRLRVRPASRRRAAMTSSYTHGFQIEEFRRPEFEVTAQASQGPFLVGGGGDVTVNAKYYAGGPLPGAPVQLVRHREPDQLHAAEPRRLHRSASGSRGGATARFDDDGGARATSRRRRGSTTARPTRPARTCCTSTSCR